MNLWDDLVKAFTTALQRLSEPTIKLIVIVAGICIVAYLARQIYKDHTAAAGLKKALSIIENSIDNSFQLILEDTRRLARSIDDLISRLR